MLFNPTKVKGAQMKTYTALAQAAIRRDNLIPTSDRNMQDWFQLVKEVQECL